MLKTVCALFSVLFFAPLASAEVFKCVGKKGEALYQNFPCQFESMGGDADGCRGRKEITRRCPGPNEINCGCPGPKKSVADTTKKPPAAPAEPQIGMTTEEVRAIWGEPTDTVQEEPHTAAF